MIESREKWTGIKIIANIQQQIENIVEHNF